MVPIQGITGAYNASPTVIYAPGHGFSNSCNTTSSPCWCDVEIATGTGISPLTGTHYCVPTDANDLAVYYSAFDAAAYGKTAGTPIVGTGAWWFGFWPSASAGVTAQWVAQVTPWTTAVGPVGFLDGTNGDLMRRVALTTQNGLAITGGIVVSGGAGNSCASTPCTVAITTTYNPTSISSQFPVASGQLFSLSDTGTPLDDCGVGGGHRAPYTINTTSTTGWVSTSFTCAGLTTGDKTNLNLNCGPTLPPSDAIQGSNLGIPCAVVSQMAYTGNPAWNVITSAVTSFSLGLSPNFKTIYDNGSNGTGAMWIYAYSALMFLVDPQDVDGPWLPELVYARDYDFRTSGVGYTWNAASGQGQANSDYNYTYDVAAYALMLPIFAPMSTSANLTAYNNRR